MMKPPPPTLFPISLCKQVEIEPGDTMRNMFLASETPERKKERGQCDIDNAATSFFVNLRTLMGFLRGSVHPVSVPLGVGSKLPLPFYAEVRLQFR